MINSLYSLTPAAVGLFISKLTFFFVDEKWFLYGNKKLGFLSVDKLNHPSPKKSSPLNDPSHHFHVIVLLLCSGTDASKVTSILSSRGEQKCAYSVG